MHAVGDNLTFAQRVYPKDNVHVWVLLNKANDGLTCL